jgi:hypothetical protein
VSPIYDPGEREEKLLAVCPVCRGIVNVSHALVDGRLVAAVHYLGLTACPGSGAPAHG